MREFGFCLFKNLSMLQGDKMNLRPQFHLCFPCILAQQSQQWGAGTGRAFQCSMGRKCLFLPLINKTNHFFKIVYTWSFSHYFLLSILCVPYNCNWHFNGGVKSTSYNAKDIVIYTLIICPCGFGFFSVCLLGVFFPPFFSLHKYHSNRKIPLIATKKQLIL